MGYKLHIVRKKDYDNFEELSNITLEEFVDLVEMCPELSWESVDHPVDNSQKTSCYWNSYPALENNNPPSLHFSNGSISTQWIEEDCLRLWLELSKALGGQLRGDENEEYDEREIENIQQRRREHSIPNIIITKTPFRKIW